MRTLSLVTKGMLVAPILLFLGLPSVVGDTPLLQVVHTTIQSGWKYNGQWQNSCNDPAVIKVEAVNQRLLVTVEVPWSNVVVGPILGQIDSNCEVVFQTEPGHFRDPCAGLNGSVMAPPVVSPADPYFYFEPDGKWHHYVGGAEFEIGMGTYPAAETFRGRCWLNDVWAFWQADENEALAVDVPG